MDTNKPLVIGTRGSALALWQARKTADLLESETRLEIIKTSGDRFQNIPLQGQAETGFFTKEIENLLVSGEIDIAVHSLKDLPTKSHPQLTLAAYLPRAAANDILLVHPDWEAPGKIFPIKDGCRVGATSLRRQALVRLYDPQAEPAMLRGNVPNRIKKCIDLQYGAIILAQAGVQRLEMDVSPLQVYQLNPDVWLPAPGQAVVAVQTRKDDPRTLLEVQKIDHAISRQAVIIERQLLANFEGGCHTAFGSYARKIENTPNPQSGETSWRVSVGLEEQNGGWGHLEIEDFRMESLAELVPTKLTGFKPVQINNREELCVKIRL